MGANTDLRLDALEAADEILEAVKAAGPEGLRFIEGASVLGIGYDRFYSIANEVAYLGKVKIGRGGNGHRNRILLPDAVEPVELAVSAGQRKVLDYLCSVADENGIARVSIKQIKLATGISCPSFVIDRLDVKGYLDHTDLGGPTRCRSYRVYPDGTGRKSDTWWLLKYGRVPAMEWAKERGYDL